jgi:hypothetical protein
MLQSARSNQFIFNFPRTFVPAEVASKYKTYLNRIPGNIISEPIDFLNYSIQSINFVGSSQDPVQQVDYPGIKRQYRTSFPVEELYAKELTVTFQLFDGFFNYWMMNDIFVYYYGLDGKHPYLPEGSRIQFLDSEGNIMVTVELERMLFQSIADLELNFSSNTAEFKTFDCTFVYNKLTTKLELQ